MYKYMNSLSGRHSELPDECHSPESDLQITLRWTLAHIPNDFLCSPGPLSLCLPVALSEPLICLHSPFPPTSAGLGSKSDTMYLETPCQVS